MQPGSPGDFDNSPVSSYVTMNTGNGIATPKVRHNVAEYLCYVTMNTGNGIATSRWLPHHHSVQGYVTMNTGNGIATAMSYPD